MKPLIPRDLDWIPNAPVAIEAKGTSTASPKAVFEVLADHERWTEWFPAVRSVTVLGPAEGVGARRRVAIPGMTVDEEFIAWEPGERWTFTGVAAKPHFTRSLIEDCRLSPTEVGGTAISYTMYLDPSGPMRALTRLIAPSIRANTTKAMAALGRRAEGPDA